MGPGASLILVHQRLGPQKSFTKRHFIWIQGPCGRADGAHGSDGLGQGTAEGGIGPHQKRAGDVSEAEKRLASLTSASDPGVARCGAHGGCRCVRVSADHRLLYIGPQCPWSGPRIDVWLCE